MISYVAGFLFNPSKDHVVLINKNRPKWQAGKLNAIGGKIEKGETALQAMEREYEEEAKIVNCDWRHFCTLRGNSNLGEQWEVFFFTATNDLKGVQTMTDEQVEYIQVDHLPDRIIPNLKWLIPLASDIQISRAVVTEFSEVI